MKNMKKTKKLYFNLILIFPTIVLITLTVYACISSNSGKVYLSKNSSYAAGSSTLNGYTVDSVRINSENYNAVKQYYYPDDISKGGGIEFTSSVWGHLDYNISGLDPNKIYKFSAHVSTENLVSTTGTGAVISTTRYIPEFCNYVFSWSQQNVKGTNNGNLDIFFISDYKGDATITIGSTFGGNDGSLTGKVVFDNLLLEEATNSDITVSYSKNKKLKIVMRNDDYNKLDSLVSNKEAATQQFVDKLEEVYESYSKFSGQNNSGYGSLYPFKNLPLVGMYANTHNYGALAGYPIEFNWSASQQISDYVNKNQMGWGELHEIGHTFDGALTSLDGTHTTKSGTWNFDGEFMANLKAMYSIGTGHVNTTKNMFTYFGQVYNETLGNSSNRTFSGDGLSYIFFQTINSNNEIDWDAMQKTFTWFNDLKSTDFLTNSAERFTWFIKKYNEFATPGHESILNVLNRDLDVRKTILDHYSYKEPEYIELWENDIFLSKNDTYEIDPDFTDNTTKGTISYESLTPSVATVDDFGNVTAVSDGDAIIRVYSFFNPEEQHNLTVHVRSNTSVLFETNYETKVAEKVITGVNTTIELPTLSRNGYTLKGWFTDPDFTDKAGNAGDDYDATESVMLYAKWTKNKYEITFDSNGGTSVSSISAKYENSIVEPEVPVKDGYTFVGWYTDSDLTQRYIFNTMPAKNFILYAKWVKATYVIGFNTNDGGETSYLAVSYNEKLEKPQDPIRKGYQFKGWYTNTELTDEYDFNKTVENDMVLYAKWIKESYAINFNSNGTIVQNTQIVLFDEKVEKPQDPTKKGYQFKGWYTNIELTNQYDFNLKVESGMTLYAKWEKEKYTVQFSSNEGSLVNSQLILYDEKAEKPQDPTREGYEFVGWYTNVELTNQYDFNETITKTITLYAKWKKKQFTIVFNTNGGNNISNQLLQYHEKVIQSETPTKVGNVFKGWYTNIELTNQYDFNLNIENNMTLYAKWEKEKYTVQFNSNGGNPINSQDILYNEKVEEPRNPTRENYEFAGWYTDTNLLNYYNFDKNITKNIILYAKWNKKQWNVSFNSNGGTAVNNVGVYYQEKLTEPTAPKKTGYLFIGWYSDSELTSKYDFNKIINNNTILYAKWNINKYIITFDSDGGSVVNIINEDYQSKIEEPQTPIKIGYTFAGWYIDKNLTTKYSFQTMPAKNITLYAKWNKNQLTSNITVTKSNRNKYKILFDSNLGSKIDNIVAYANENIVEPTVPIREGYTFAGWYEDKNLTKKYSFKTMPTKNITLYAKWTKNKYKLSFNSNGGSSIKQMEVEYNTKINNLKEPIRLNYVFIGWYIDKELTTEFTLEQMPAKDIILYAKWELEDPVIKKLNKDNNIVVKANKSGYSLNAYKNLLKLPEYYQIKVQVNDKDLLDNDLIPTGSITYLYVNGKPINKHINIIKGDTNKDGKISISDINNISNYIKNNKSLTDDIQKQAADVVEDNKIKLSDIVAIYDNLEDK